VLRHLHIEKFRALREFEMTGLGRVNVLVGTNNCGKTSVLEAIHILSAPGSTGPLWNTLLRRGETHSDGAEREADVAHLVHGHEIDIGPAFSVSGTNDDDARSVIATFNPRDLMQPLPIVPGRTAPRQQYEPTSEDEGGLAPIELLLEWRFGQEQREIRWPLTRRGGLLRDVRSGTPIRTVDNRPAVHFITTEGLAQDAVISLFDETVLTPDEATVLQALRTIEPNIERLASVGTSSRFAKVGARGGIAMLVGGKRLPIGSMGDGIWRLLGIALALVRASGGVLLVDEIDTGLHFSVLVDMWRLVYETASRLDVQVFATTHSRDCYEALASVTQPDRHDISLQRIERGKPLAVAFSEVEICQAAERGIEVR
jgi:hypothetical protein